MKRKKYSEQDYIEKCKSLNLIYIGTHKKEHDGTMIDFKCDKHIDKGIQSVTWSHFKTAKVGCPYCTGRYRTTEEFNEIIKNKQIETLSEYKGSEIKVTFKCLKCDYIWNTVPRSITSNGSGCPKCSKILTSQHESKSHDTFVEELKNKNKFIKVLGKYNGNKTPIEAECLNCGNIWKSTPIRMLRGESGCPRCNLSDGERKMLMLLDDLNIKYIPQYKIDECRNIYPLRFDAFDINNNVGFEFNGEQHYHPIYIKSEKYNPTLEFEKIQTRDNIKKEYCIKNNIPLIIIPYWEKDNMRDFLLSEFKKEELYHNK